MKIRYTLLFLLVLFCPCVAQSQSVFAPLGAQWWHFGSGFDYESSTINYFTFHTVAELDTTINGTNCRKLTTDINEVIVPGPVMTIPYQLYKKDLFFYNNEDTIFVFNDNFGRFTPVYVFNAGVGDTICLPVPPSPNPDLRINPISGDTSFCFVLDSVKILVYDTAHLKTFYTHPLFGGPGPNGHNLWPTYNYGRAIPPAKGVYIEKIIGALLPVEVRLCSECNNFQYAPHGELRCYFDADYSIKLTSLPCDTIQFGGQVDVNEFNLFPNSLKISPNPNSGEFTLIFEEAFAPAGSLTITDISGKVVYQSILTMRDKKKTISLGKIDSGIYLLSWKSPTQYLYKKLIVN